MNHVIPATGNPERYLRHTMLPGIGEEGQKRLLRSSVLIVGLGGLGSPAALYLASAGVGHIGLCDPDIVSLSNLQRQVIYDETLLGVPKPEAAARRLSALNSDVRLSLYTEGLTPANANGIVGDYDVVVDCTDNHKARYLIDDVCRRLHIPWVYGSIGEFCGQVSTFLPDGPGYASLFPDREELEARPPASGGVFGALPGIIGAIESAEALKLLIPAGKPLAARILTFNLLTMAFEEFSYA